jgi:hypothetical protein
VFDYDSGSCLLMMLKRAERVIGSTEGVVPGKEDGKNDV